MLGASPLHTGAPTPCVPLLRACLELRPPDAAAARAVLLPTLQLLRDALPSADAAAADGAVAATADLPELVRLGAAALDALAQPLPSAPAAAAASAARDRGSARASR